MNGITELKASALRSVGQGGHETASERVVVKLREMIQRGELRPGDRLPPQRDLAKLFGVSRPSLSAGIGSLAAVGILHSRQGAGTFVVETEESPALDNGSLRLMAALHGFTSTEMLEAQQALETTIAGLAAERATSDQMVSLAEEIAAMYASLDDPEQYSIHDAHFHQLVAAASGNRILSALMKMLPALLPEVRRETVEHTADLKESAEVHLQVYRAIRGRNPEAARTVMHNHLKLTQGVQESEKKDA